MQEKPYDPHDDSSDGWRSMMVIMGILFIGIFGFTLVIVYETYTFNNWYNSNAEMFKTDIVHQIDTLRADHGLSPVTVVNTVNGISIIKNVDIDNPDTSLKGFEAIFLNPDIQYIAIDTRMPTVGTFSSTQMCCLEIWVG